MTTKKQAQEVAVKAEQQLAFPMELMNSWDTDRVETKDIKIPRALLMQPMSDLVGEKKAKVGQIIDSVSYSVLGDEENALEVVPIHTFKSWTIQKLVNGKYEYDRAEPYTPQNATRPREEEILGVKFQNVETINLLAMRTVDVDNLESLPFLVTFRMTSYSCGKDILTLKANCQRVNKPFPSYAIKLIPEFTKNDKGSFYVMKFAGATPYADFQKNAATLKTWFDTFKSGDAKIDEEVVDKTETTVTDTRF